MKHSLTYETYRASLDEQIHQSVDHVNDARKTIVASNHEIVMNQMWKMTFSDTVTKVLSKYLEKDMSLPIIADLLVHPPKNIQTDWKPDFALPMFEFAKILKKNPMQLANEVVDQAKDLNVFSRIESAGAYVNVQLNDTLLQNGVKSIINLGAQFGRLTDNTGRVAIVEYSSPNVAKPFGINHLRSTVIGEAIARLFAFSGYTVVRDNHLGDWGTQFGNLLAAHQEYASERDFSTLTMDDLTEIYVKFSQEKKNSPKLVRLGQSYFAKLDAGDSELREKWAAALDMSMSEFSLMYKRLGVVFDTQIGEGYYVEAANNLVDKLLDNMKHPLIIRDPDTKAVYIDGESPVILRTQDGYCIYGARDLATLLFRIEKYSPDDIVYVVGEEQASYFRTVFMAAQQMGWLDNPQRTPTHVEHVGFGLLLDKNGKKLSTRKGTSGKLEDVINMLDERAIEETKSRNPDMPLDQVKEIANKIAIGAIIWNDLHTERTSNIRFDITNMLQLGGGTVIDIFYSYSRTCSVLQKIDTNLELKWLEKYSSDTEHLLAVRLNEFEDVIRKAVNERAPHVIVGYLQELSQIHGRFYQESRIIGIDDNSLASMRAALHVSYKIVVSNGLHLLNIPITERL